MRALLIRSDADTLSPVVCEREVLFTCLIVVSLLIVFNIGTAKDNRLDDKGQMRAQFETRLNVVVAKVNQLWLHAQRPVVVVESLRVGDATFDRKGYGTTHTLHVRLHRKDLDSFQRLDFKDAGNSIAAELVVVKIEDF